MARIDFVTGAPEKYAHLVDRLSTLPDRLRTAVEGRSTSELRSEPPGDGWSVHRILAHLAVYAHVNGVFIHRMVTMYDAERTPFDEDAIIAESGYLRTTPEALIEVIEDEIGKTVHFLSETPDAAWGRRGMIRGYGRSVRQQVQWHIDHLEEHLAQIQGALAQQAETPAANAGS